MSVTMSKPRKPVKVVRSANAVRGLRWRSREERVTARRKIDAIRRAAEQEHAAGVRVDTSLLRSPKVLLGIVAILLGLGGLLVGKSGSVTKGTPLPLQLQRTQRSVVVLAKALTYYRVHTKSWPTQQDGIWSLVRNPHVEGWRGPYINAFYKDSWKHPYVYRMPLSPFECPEVFSMGPDGIAGTADDIRAETSDFVCSEGSWRAEASEDERSVEKELAE